MAKYVLMGENILNDFFAAEDDEAAEEYVNDNYDEEDEKMTLYKLEHVCSWN